jgi:hypothetical protein
MEAAMRQFMMTVMALATLGAMVVTAQAQSPGTKESLVRFIQSMQRGRPNYDEMSPELAAINRSQVSRTGPLMKSLGPLKSITFRTANADGWDVYDATFKKARVEFSIAPLTSDGKVTDRRWEIISGSQAVSPAQRAMQECQARYKFAGSQMWVERWPFVEACFKEKTGLYPGQANVNCHRSSGKLTNWYC